MRTILVLLAMAMVAPSLRAGDGAVWTAQDAVRAALHDHPAGERADALERYARGMRRASLSPGSPSAAVEYEGIPEGEGIEAWEERRVALTQEIDFPLRWVWRLRRENARVEAAVQERRGLLLDLEQQVRTAYLNAWHARERLIILERYAAGVDTQAATFQRMNEVGRIADLDAGRAVAEAAEVRADLQAARADWRAARIELVQLTGGPPPDSLATPLDSTWREPGSEEAWRENPELLASRSHARAAREQKTLAATSWLPRIEASGFRQRVPGGSTQDLWGAEIGLSVPLWFVWGGVGEVQAASAQKRMAGAESAALERSRRARWEAEREAQRAHRERLETYERTLLPTSETVQRLSRTSYEAGRADYLDVLVAQRTHLQRRLGYLDTIHDLVSSRIALDRLAGRSLVGVNDDVSE